MHRGPPSAKRRADSPPQIPEIHQSHLKPSRHRLFPKDETRVSKTRVLVLYDQEGQNQEKLILVLLTLDQHSLAQPSTAQYHCCGPAHTDLRMLVQTSGCWSQPQDTCTHCTRPSALPPSPGPSLALTLPCPVFSSPLAFS